MDKKQMSEINDSQVKSILTMRAKYHFNYEEQIPHEIPFLFHGLRYNIKIHQIHINQTINADLLKEYNNIFNNFDLYIVNSFGIIMYDGPAFIIDKDPTLIVPISLENYVDFTVTFRQNEFTKLPQFFDKKRWTEQERDKYIEIILVYTLDS